MKRARKAFRINTLGFRHPVPPYHLLNGATQPALGDLKFPQPIDNKGRSVYESRGAVIWREIPENIEVISTISVFFNNKCVIFGFSGSNIVEGKESPWRDNAYFEAQD